MGIDPQHAAALVVLIGAAAMITGMRVARIMSARIRAAFRR